MSGLNEEWTYFSDEKFSGIVMSLRPGDRYFYRAPDGQRFEVSYIARKRSRIRIGMRPVDENGIPLKNPSKGDKENAGNTV